MSKLLIDNEDDPYKIRAEFVNTSGSHVPFTRACAMWPFVDFLDTIGAPTERFLQQAGIPVALLEQSEALVPLHLGYSFLEHAAYAEGIDNIGLVVAQQASAYDLGVFGKRLREAITVQEFIQTVLRMIGTVTSGQQFWLTGEGSQVRVHQYLPGNVGPGRRIEILIMCLHYITTVSIVNSHVCSN